MYSANLFRMFLMIQLFIYNKKICSQFRTTIIFNLWKYISYLWYEKQDIRKYYFNFDFLLGQGGARFIYKPYKYPDKYREIIQDDTGSNLLPAFISIQRRVFFLFNFQQAFKHMKTKNSWQFLFVSMFMCIHYPCCFKN